MTAEKQSAFGAEFAKQIDGIMRDCTKARIEAHNAAAIEWRDMRKDMRVIVDARVPQDAMYFVSAEGMREESEARSLYAPIAPTEEQVASAKVRTPPPHTSVYVDGVRVNNVTRVSGDMDYVEIAGESFLGVPSKPRIVRGRVELIDSDGVVIRDDAWRADADKRRGRTG